MNACFYFFIFTLFDFYLMFLFMSTKMLLTNHNNNVDADEDDELEAHTVLVHGQRPLCLKIMMCRLRVFHIEMVALQLCVCVF